MVTPTVFRVAERVRELGWGDEVDLMPEYEEQYETLPEVREFCEKDLTESGKPLPH